MKNNNLKIIFQSALVQISQTFSRPMFKYVVIIQPLFYSLMLYMIYRNSTPEDYISYAIIGTSALTLWSSIIYSSASDIDREKFIGTMPYIVVTPSKFSLILIGKILGNTLLGLVPSGMIVLILTKLSNIYFLKVNLINFTFSLILFLLTFLIMAFFLCLVFTLSREIRLFMNFLIYPIYILCGVVFPIEILPNHIKIISNILPPTWALKIIRKSITGQSLFKETFILIVLLIFYSICSYFFLRKFYNNIRVNGTLEVF